MAWSASTDGEVEGAGSRITEIGELVADLPIAPIHGPQPLAERRLGLAEGQEVQSHGAIMKGVGGRAANDLVALGLCRVGRLALSQFHMGEVGGLGRAGEAVGVFLGAAKDALLVREG